ncbi:glycosyltransferase [Cryptosporangium arvum]|uniref:UDP-glucoronosyl and UDP-glucosyl transferase n=1 Tax=Cryptosporangium arvum DSM 44712 TaxID=927661 RepID=A0A010Z428_9ACTN|nr:glycosyltransferase [Cryptosporangium arvum]EXG82143.1 UDP-glucoronosyl and UDP-glucosyl transferase [Cryptosporangium arvum DSM 44712]
MDATRRPILFSCTESAGVFNPHVLLAGELAGRGVDDLWFATDENRRGDVEAASDKTDVRFLSMGEVNPRDVVTNYDDRTYRAVTQPEPFKAYLARVKQSLDLDGHYARYHRLAAAVDEIRPALLVINNLNMHAVHLAVTRNIPFVLVAPCLPSDVLKATLPPEYPAPGTGLPLRMDARQQQANRRFRRRKRTMFLDGTVLKHSIAFEKARKAAGIDAKVLNSAAIMDQVELILCFSVFGLEYPFDATDKLRMLGAAVPPVPDGPADDVVTWLDAHRSVVFVSFSSGMRLTEAEIVAVTEAARRLGDHSVLWKLPPSQQALLGDLPPNLRVVDAVRSPAEVLAHPHVRAFVNHGGSNSVNQGLYFGRPLLIRPLWLDGRDHAVRVADSGVGLTVDALTADALHTALTRLLTEPSFTERADHLGRAQRSAGGVPAAADLILETPSMR